MLVNAKEKKLWKQIIALLKSENTNQRTILIFLQSIIAQSKVEIESQGIMVNVRADDAPLFQMNQAVSIYRDSLK